MRTPVEIAREKLLDDYTGSWPEVTSAENGITGKNPSIERFRGKIDSLWQEACDSCETNKARIDKMLEILPENLRNPHIVVKIKEKKKLRKTIESLIKQGKCVGLRTCFDQNDGPAAGTSPWVMGLKDRRATEKFFKKIYPKWRKLNNLREIIVMGNPQGLGEESLAQNHFVFRVEAFTPQELRVELRMGTEQLRDVENEAARQDLVEIKMEIPENFYGIFSPGEIVVTPGESYLNTSFLPKDMVNLLSQKGIVWSGKEETRAIINPLSLGIINKIIGTVFGEWTRRPEENIYYLLLALKKFGLNSLEFQGRQDRGKVKWIKAHGFRGIKEEYVPPYIIRKLDGD